jgi:hypothetical protein
MSLFSVSGGSAVVHIAHPSLFSARIYVKNLQLQQLCSLYAMIFPEKYPLGACSLSDIVYLCAKCLKK